MCDLTDDPAAVFKHYDYFCILPMWDCIAIMNIFICVLTDSGATQLKDYASRPRSQEVAIEAVDLHDEEGDALKVV